MRAILLSITLLISPLAAAQISPSSVELGLPHSIGSLAPAPVPQVGPAIASSGDEALAVWLDVRTGAFGEVWGARIDANGEVIDPRGFPIGERGQALARSDLAVAWADGVYLVVWERDYREVVGVRVSAEGEVLDERPVRYGLGWTGGVPHLVSNGDLFLLYMPGVSDELVLIDRTGTVIAKRQHPIFGELDGYIAAFASDGHDFFLVGRLHAGGWRTITISLEGPITVNEVAMPIDLLWLDLAWTGEEYLLLGASAYLDPFLGLLFARFAPDGVLLESTQLLPEEYRKAISPKFVIEGDGSITASWISFEPPYQYGTGGTLLVSRIDGEGALEGTIVTENVSQAVMVAVGADPVLVWETIAPGLGRSSRLLLASVRDVSGARQFPADLTTAPARQGLPAVARTQTSTAYVWEHHEPDHGSKIAFATGSAAVGVLDQSTILAPSTGIQMVPAIAGHPGGYFVVWQERAEDYGSQKILGTRVSGDGVALDAAPTRFSTTDLWAAEPDVIWNGRYYLVTWIEAEKVVLSRVTAEGIVLDEVPVEVMASPRETWQSRPRLATSSQGITLLVWQDGSDPYICQITCPAPPPSGVIHGVRLDVEGRVIDAQPIEISPQQDHEIIPAVGASGDQFLVVWRSWRGIEGTRVGLDGTVHRSGTNPPIIIQGEPNQRPSIAPVTEGWMIAWEQFEGTGVDSAVHAVVVRHDDAVVPPLLILADEPRREQAPVLMRLSDSLTLLAYLEVTHESSPWAGTVRLFARTVYRDGSSSPLPRRRGLTRP